MAAILGGALPLATLLLFILMAQARGYRLPEAVIVAALVWALVAVVSAEALSCLHSLTRGAVAAVWVAALVIAVAVSRQLDLTLRVPQIWKSNIDYGNAILGIVLIAGVIGLVAAPNNWDSMTYHLSRVEHWIQNASLDHYPTAITRQLDLAPLAEMLILQFRILTDGDRLDALVQTLAFAGAIAAASSVACHLGASRAVQSLAALLVATIPMGILQASSTQNDLVVSFFILSGAERLLAWRESQCPSDWVLATVAFGLAFLTKGTAYLFGAPFLILAGVMALQSGKVVRLAAIMGALTIGLNAGHVYRNSSYFSNPFGTLAGIAGTKAHGLGAVYSGVLRNVASNFATPIKPVNRQLAEVVGKAHSLFALDVNDPDTTVEGTTFNLSSGVLHEDTAPNPLHTALALMSLGLLVWALATKKTLARELIAYTAAASVGGLLFCLMLKWQPWITRLQLPFFVLLAPAGAILLCGFLRPIVVRRISMVLIVAAIPAVVGNALRPIVPFARGNIITTGHWGIMFNAREYLREPYLAAVTLSSASKPTNIGLVIGQDSWEYPIWALIKDKIGLAGRRIEHICTEQPAIPTPRFSAEVVLLIARPAPDVLECEGKKYVVKQRFEAGKGRPESIYVYLREPQ